MSTSYQRANKKDEREILVLYFFNMNGFLFNRRSELLCEMKDFIACETEETNTHTKYYNLLSKIRSLQSFQQEDMISLVQSLEKKAAVNLFLDLFKHLDRTRPFKSLR